MVKKRYQMDIQCLSIVFQMSHLQVDLYCTPRTEISKSTNIRRICFVKKREPYDVRFSLLLLQVQDDPTVADEQKRLLKDAFRDAIRDDREGARANGLDENVLSRLAVDIAVAARSDACFGCSFSAQSTRAKFLVSIE